MTMHESIERRWLCFVLCAMLCLIGADRPARGQESTPAPASGASAQQPQQTEKKDGEKKEGENKDGKSAESQEKAMKKKLTASLPVLEIKRLEAEEAKYSLELRDVPLGDLFRVIAHDYNLNIMVDAQVTGTITASFTNVSLEEALEAIAEMSNLNLEKKGKILKVSPNLITKTFVLKHVEAKKLLAAAKDEVKESSQASSSGSTSGSGSDSEEPASAGFFGLLSPLGRVLLGHKQNSIMVIDYPANVKRVEDYLQVVDQRMNSRVFKLKYLKASDMLGQTGAAGTGTTTTTTTSGAGGAPSAGGSTTGSGG